MRSMERADKTPAGVAFGRFRVWPHRRELLSLATAHRLVTLTGAGGIGKTRLALAAARQLLPHFADGVWLAELSPLSDPGLVPAAVAAAVGLELGGGEISAQRVAQALAERRLLACAGYLRACDRRRCGNGRGCAGDRRGAAYHRHQPRGAASGRRMG